MPVASTSRVIVPVHRSGKLIPVPILKSASPVPACKVLFSPKAGISKELSRMTQAAAQEISVAAYAFSSKYLGNALIAAMKRGVKIRLILDRGNAEKSYSLDEWLIENGIDIRFLKVKSGCMHHKFMIIDRIRLMAGSYNFTNDSEFRNHEAALFINATETTDITTSIAATAKDMTGHNTKAPAGEHAATVNPDTSKTKASDIVKAFTAEFERLWSLASAPIPKAANSRRCRSQSAHRRIPRLFGGKG